MLYGFVTGAGSIVHERVERERWARVLEKRAPAELSAREASALLGINVDRLLRFLEGRARFELEPEVRFSREALVRSLRGG